MARSATSRLKCNSPLGSMPAMQYLPPDRLSIDPFYQRSIETGASQSLIRKIAQHWNWDLCQPLVVAARPSGELKVIDGQHRLEAARLRGDITQLPCVLVQYESTADEAASFVHLNQQRKPLSKLDLFKAAIASEDPEACAILAALEAARLSVAPHSNHISWKPGMVSNIGGIEAAWRRHGPAITKIALRILARGFEGQVLQYAGTMFPGIVALCANREAEGLIALLKGRSQKDWRALVLRARAEDSDLTPTDAVALVLRRALHGGNEKNSPPLPTARPADRANGERKIAKEKFRAGKAFCAQCDMMVTLAEAETCRSRFCKVKVAA